MKKKISYLFVIVCFCVPNASYAALNTINQCASKEYPAQLKFERRNFKEVRALLNDVDGKLIPEIWIDAPNQKSPPPDAEKHEYSYLIAACDLNDDGSVEFFVLQEGEGVCGKVCPMTVYSKGLNKSFHEIFHVGTLPHVTVLRDKYKNYHDIVFRNDLIWRWDGTTYRFYKAQSAAKKD